jgi:hypothetical protein
MSKESKIIYKRLSMLSSPIYMAIIDRIDTSIKFLAGQA